MKAGYSVLIIVNVNEAVAFLHRPFLFNSLIHCIL